jgi:nucleoid DNA-binding protein
MPPIVDVLLHGSETTLCGTFEICRPIQQMSDYWAKAQLIDAISESSEVFKNDVKAVIDHMATIGYKELNESGEFVIPGFAKMSVVNKPATEARSGINPFTKSQWNSWSNRPVQPSRRRH